MNLVMPDAKILAGFNATSIRISPFGQFILSKIAANGQALQAITAATGFNPLQDVSEVLAATTADPSSPGGLLLVSGTFPVDKITESVTRALPGASVTTYGGARLIEISAPKAKTGQAVAFIGNAIAVGGDLASVKAAIDRSTGSNSIDPMLAVAVNQLSASEDEWLASSVSPGSLIPANSAAGVPANSPLQQVLPLLKNILAFQGGVKFAETVQLTGEATTSSAQNAGALQAILKLGVMLGESALTSNKDPVVGDLVQLLQSLQVTTSGAAVDLSLPIPEAQIEAALNTSPAIGAAEPAKGIREGRPRAGKSPGIEPLP
jgi:hypothetical protein